MLPEPEQDRPSHPEGTIPGRVDLVGAGPGDPGLLTRRGAACLAESEVVVYDHLVSPRLLDLAPASAERIFAGKTSGKCALKQGEINALLVALARAGRRVVRLKGGDPYIFGRGAEEAEYLLAAGVPVRVIPGVTSALGASAYAGLSLTRRDSASAVAFVTGHDDPGAPASRLDWPALARFPGTLVVYMGVGKLAAICERLIAEGKPAETPAALVHAGTLASQRRILATLADLPSAVRDARAGPPALLMVGEAIGKALPPWFMQGPLFGSRVVVTRPGGETDASALDLEALGAEVIAAPTVVIRPVEDFGPLDDAIARLPDFDWLVFTSGNGVRHFLDRLGALGKDLRALGRVQIAAIGPATAEALATYRLRADLVPPSYRSEALAEALVERARGRSVLLARADRGREVLREELGRVARVEQVACYRNVDAEALPAGVADRVASGSVDWITLTSPAIARRLHALLPEEARAEVGRSARLATISPVTSAAARELGWPVAAEAREYTWDGVVRAMAEANRPAQRNSL